MLRASRRSPREDREARSSRGLRCGLARAEEAVGDGEARATDTERQLQSDRPAAEPSGAAARAGRQRARGVGLPKGARRRDGGCVRRVATSWKAAPGSVSRRPLLRRRTCAIEPGRACFGSERPEVQILSPRPQRDLRASRELRRSWEAFPRPRERPRFPVGLLSSSLTTRVVSGFEPARTRGPKGELPETCSSRRRSTA